MAKKKDFNLSETIRQYRKSNPKATAMQALEAITKSSGQRINEGTFKSTFYKLVGQGRGKGRVVRRRKPGRGGATDGPGVITSATAFIRAAGGIEQAKRILAELEVVREL
jgi:hypothetical protein